MKHNLPDRVLKEIIFFAKENNIDKILLFGSRSRSTHKERSDIDIAVIGGNFDSFYWDIKDKINSLLSFDIVEYNSNVSDELKKEIERDGILIYEKA